MTILAQFVLRLSFGLAFAMGLTSPKKVTSGYFRNHAYVLLGLNVVGLLAAIARPTNDNPWHFNPWLLLAIPILSYFCCAAWLYEKSQAGRVLLWLVAAASLIGMWLEQPMPLLDRSGPTPWRNVVMYDLDTVSFLPMALLWRSAAITSGLVLGSTVAAMFLSHWYLNSPTMELAPLRRLLRLMAISIAAQAIVSALSLTLELHLPWISGSQYPLIALRWLGGIVGTGILTYMAWRTLQIPNTQSATGLLYVAVITTFLGELTSLLLCSSTGYPL